MEIKKWSDAVKALKEAARLDSDDPDPHLMLAACYAQMKRNADVVKELRYVLEIDPDNQVAQTILSRANH
jgi:Flp pilus assembly protein TadD